jgi:uncharacterized phage protein (TIGR01671 family)
MNRELKFRIYDKKRKEWLHDTEHAISLFGEAVLLGGITQRKDGSHVSLRDLNNLAAMQYVGLKDKNGKKIFEGDIIVSRNTLGGETCGIPTIIYWDKNKKGWGLKNRIHETIWYFAIEDFEIIGNRWDNPELLEITK